MKKRIVATVINDLSHDQRMHKICSTLGQAGYEVLLVGRVLKRSRPFSHPDFRTRRIRCFFTKGKGFYLEYNLRLFFLLLFIRADIFYAVDLDTILPHTLAGGLRRKKRVYDAHEYFTEVPEVVGRRRVQAMWQRVARYCIPKMDLCYTVGECLAGVFSQEYNKPFHVIMNVPVWQQGDFAEGQGAFILYQGALNQGRGLEALILSMKEISLPLWIAGEGDLSTQLRTMVKEQGLEDKVKFLGWVSPQELKTLTRQAYLGYNVLENKGLSYYYSLANKFFDYIHAGVPSLCSAFPEYEKINSSYEVAFLTNLSAESIVLNINRATGEQVYYNSLRENCKKASHVYNWQAESKKLIELFYEL